MISVIIPVYNTVKYLDECVHSILDQTISDWECLLVDDGSTDGSGEKCDFWAEKDCRIKVIHQQNKGVSAARNVGLEKANGHFVAFIDSDDWIEGNCLQILLDKILSSNADLSITGLIYDYPDKSLSCQSSVDIVQLGVDDVDGFVDLNKQYLLFGPVAKLYKTGIIQRHHLLFDESYCYGEDLLFNYTYLNHIERIANIPECKYHYRQIAGSLSRRAHAQLFSIKYAQWKVQQEFYQQKGMWLKSAQELLYSRLWGIIYDAVFVFPHLEQKRFSYLRTVLQTPEIDCLGEYSDSFDCANWIKRALLHRQAWLFFLYFISR